MFKCDQCDKRFTTKINLKAHVSTHTGEPLAVIIIITTYYKKTIGLNQESSSYNASFVHGDSQASRDGQAIKSAMIGALIRFPIIIRLIFFSIIIVSVFHSQGFKVRFRNYQNCLQAHSIGIFRCRILASISALSALEDLKRSFS